MMLPAQECKIDEMKMCIQCVGIFPFPRFDIKRRHLLWFLFLLFAQRVSKCPPGVLVSCVFSSFHLVCELRVSHPKCWCEDAQRNITVNFDGNIKFYDYALTISLQFFFSVGLWVGRLLCLARATCIEWSRNFMCWRKTLSCSNFFTGRLWFTFIWYFYFV